eukprot:Gb_36649 [translate_table: standard]
MHDLSPVEGFLEVHESLSEMMKHAANEPSVGLFFVQQHAHKAVPTLVSIKDKVVDTSQEAFLCTEDMNDAIISIRSMKECGPPIIERMIRNLDSSISVMSSMHQLRGQCQRAERQGLSNRSGKDNTFRAVWGSAFQKAGSASWRLRASSVHQVGGCNQESSSVTHEKYDESTEGHSGTDLGTSKRYLRSFKSALQRAGNLGWSRTNIDNATDINSGNIRRNDSTGPLNDVSSMRPACYEHAMEASDIFSSETVGQEGTVFLTEDLQSNKDIEGDNQLPVSSQALLQSDCGSDMQIPEGLVNVDPKLNIKALESKGKYKQFQSECVAKLEAWLIASDNGSTSNAEEHDLRPVV